MEEGSYGPWRLCRLLGNPAAFAVVQLLAENKKLSVSEIARAVQPAGQDPKPYLTVEGETHDGHD